MTETTLTVAEVDDEISGAESEVADLEQRVIDGDAKVTPSMISKAREKLDFLGLRRKAAEKAEREASEERHRNAIEQFDRDYHAFVTTGRAELVDQYAAVVESIRELHHALDARARAEYDFTARAEGLGIHNRAMGNIGPAYLDYAIEEGKTGVRRVIGFVTDERGRHKLHRPTG